MKRHLPLLVMVPLFLVTFYIGTGDTQTDPGLVRWLQDHNREIQTNRQLINHEQQKRMELENRLVQMLQNDSRNIREHLRRLENRINAIESRLNDHMQLILKLKDEASGN